MVKIKKPYEIELMREAGRRLAIVHQELENAIRPGISTKDLDDLAYEVIMDLKCKPNFLNYQGFPGTACVSVNDEVVHGIPHPDHIIDEGDIVSLDLGLIYKGYHSDAARTHGVGEISEEARLLIERTRESFFQGLAYVRSGNFLGQVSAAISDYAESFGYGVVYDLCGHGIGKHLHEEPEIPNYRTGKRGLKLRSGMTLAIEPMINLGCADVFWDEDDGWTVLTDDGSLSAHYENTVLVTDGEPEIFTLTEKESRDDVKSRCD